MLASSVTNDFEFFYRHLLRNTALQQYTYDPEKPHFFLHGTLEKIPGRGFDEKYRFNVELYKGFCSNIGSSSLLYPVYTEVYEPMEKIIDSSYKVVERLNDITTKIRQRETGFPFTLNEERGCTIFGNEAREKDEARIVPPSQGAKYFTEMRKLLAA